MAEVEKNFDAIIKQYLINRGYSKAAAQLEDDLRAQDTSNHLTVTADIQELRETMSRQIMSTFTQNVELLTGGNHPTDFYKTEYEILRSWIHSSLDIVKAELLQVLFPIFVHCYIGIVKQSDLDEAKIFWRAWHEDHIDNHGDELRLLSLLTSKHQLHMEDFLDANAFIRQAVKSRFLVPMSSFAFGMLSTFLVHNSLLLLATIINDKIQIEQTIDAPGTLSNSITLDGYIPRGDESDVSGGAVDVSKAEFGSQAASSAALKLWAPSRGVPAPDLKDDILIREWISKLVQPKALLSDREAGGKRSSEAAQSRVGVGSKVRLSEHPEKKSRGSSRFGEAGGASGRGSRSVLPDPSVIFATITNTHDDMTCMDINRGASQAAAGFKDSCVRVWKLNEKDQSFGSLLGAQGVWTLRDVMPMPRGSSGAAAASTASAAAARAASAATSTKAALMRPMLELRGHRKAVYGVSQDDTCRLVLSGSADCTVRLWDTTVAQCVGRYDCLAPVWSVSLGPLGYYFAAACQDGTASVFSTDRITPLRMLTGHVSDVTSVSWHENGTLLATCSDDRTARLWDIRSGKCVRLFEGSAWPLSCVATTALATGGVASSLLAAGSDSGTAYLWDVGTARRIAVLQGHEDCVYSVAFSRDGSSLVTGAADCSMRIFDVKSIAAAPSTVSSLDSLQNPRGSAATSSSASSATSSGQHSMSSSRATQREATPIIAATHTFHTKLSPVFCAGFTDAGMLFAGGPFSLPDSSRPPRESTVAATETDTASALGLSQTVLLTS